jgi:hypothetical protein
MTDGIALMGKLGHLADRKWPRGIWEYPPVTMILVSCVQQTHLGAAIRANPS